MKAKTKPKYNIAQNVGWMVKIAWKTRKRVLLFCVLTAVLEILYNLAQLYIAPEILRRVEDHAAMGSLLGTIAFFTAALFLTLGLKDYIKENTLFVRVDVRSAIIGMISYKCNTTSFPNTLNADYMKLRDKSYMACNNNREATELIWQTITLLLQNTGGFLIYLTILSYLDRTLLAVVIATCILGFLVSRYTNNWMFTHREAEEVYYAKKQYIRDKAVYPRKSGICGAGEGYPHLRFAKLAQ